MGEVGADTAGESEEPLARRFSGSALVDGFFFVFAGLASVWLAWLIFTESFAFGWWGIAFFLLFWAVLAYLVLPRLHRILTAVYVPAYFIGRARTSDGLLGDPVNLALDGEEASLHAAFRTAGWTRADDVGALSSWRIITSTVTRRSYDEAPVSPLFLFGRQQDFAYQQEVERNHIVTTVLAANPAAQVSVLADFSTGYHSRNGGGDSIRTDGDLPVLDLQRVPVATIEATDAPAHPLPVDAEATP